MSMMEIGRLAVHAFENTDKKITITYGKFQPVKMLLSKISENKFNMFQNVEVLFSKHLMHNLNLLAGTM